MKTARKLGVSDEEAADLSQAFLNALEDGALDPEELKQCAAGNVRNLGPDGVKKGVTTTLPVALGMLQPAGEIRR